MIFKTDGSFSQNVDRSDFWEMMALPVVPFISIIICGIAATFGEPTFGKVIYACFLLWVISVAFFIVYNCPDSDGRGVR